MRHGSQVQYRRVGKMSWKMADIYLLYMVEFVVKRRNASAARLHSQTKKANESRGSSAQHVARHPTHESTKRLDLATHGLFVLHASCTDLLPVEVRHSQLTQPDSSFSSIETSSALSLRDAPGISILIVPPGIA